MRNVSTINLIASLLIGMATSLAASASQLYLEEFAITHDGFDISGSFVLNSETHEITNFKSSFGGWFYVDNYAVTPTSIAFYCSDDCNYGHTIPHYESITLYFASLDSLFEEGGVTQVTGDYDRALLGPDIGYTGTVTTSLAPTVPLPPAALFMAGALPLLGVFRRKRLA